MSATGSPAAAWDLAAYMDEPVAYRGYPVSRGDALLLESELEPDSIDGLYAVDALDVLAGHSSDELMPAAYVWDLIIKERERATLLIQYVPPPP